MFNIKILPDGNLKISASNAGRQWLKENESRGYWPVTADIFEPYACNGSFVHFDSGAANPFIGLTSAPCIAETIEYSDIGEAEIVGKLWVFTDYQTLDDLAELKNKGCVIYSKVDQQ